MAPRLIRTVDNVVYVVFSSRPRRARPVSKRDVLRLVRWARWGAGDCA